MVEKILNNGDCVESETTNCNSNDIELNLVRNKLQHFQASILKDVEKRISGMIDEVLQEIRQHKLQTSEFKNFAYKTQQKQNESTWSNRMETDVEKLKEIYREMEDTTDNSKASTDVTNATDRQMVKNKKKKRPLPNKIFVMRESYLTALLKVDHMKTIYHIFYIILLMLFMNSICYDYFVDGRINFGLGTFKSGLVGIHYVFGIWCIEHLVVFTLYYAFKGWAHVRSKLLNQKSMLNFWTHSCLIAYVSSQLLFGFVGSILCLKLDLPFVTASILLLETTRLLMKMHAFVRFNAARVIDGKLKIDMDHDNPETQTTRTSANLPSFSCYLYFLFAPTLIYRDHYPRTSQIHWRFAFSRLMEVVAIAFIYSYIYESHIKVHFSNYGKEELNASALIVKLFGMIMPSTIIFLCGFYMILHSWLNFTSEILRFGDRMFYKDWWTTSTYDAYYRNWNVVVHDWLYEYIYKDFYTYVFKGSKIGASLTVFLVSAIVHEHIIGFALQIFFPVIFLFFGIIGLALVFISRSFSKNIGNIFIWFSLIFGNGLLFSLYSMEYFARCNCPKDYDNVWDYFVPRIWSCYN